MIQWESSLSFSVTFLRSEISSRATSEYSLADLTILRATCWLVVLDQRTEGGEREGEYGESRNGAQGERKREANVQVGGEPDGRKVPPAKLRYYLEPRVVNASYLYWMIATYNFGGRCSRKLVIEALKTQQEVKKLRTPTVVLLILFLVRRKQIGRDPGGLDDTRRLRGILIGLTLLGRTL